MSSVDTFEAAAVACLALLPGALFTWSFERLVGRWGVGLSDRLLRFVGWTAVFHALAAPVTYGLWIGFVRSHRVGGTLPPQLWLAPIAYVGVPIGVGTIAALGHRRGKPWAQLFTGKNPAPRAWDYLFAGDPVGWVRCRLKSKAWVGGIFGDSNGRRSYVAGYPEPADLFLARRANVDPETGDFLLDDDGHPSLADCGLLVRWDEVEYLEFVDT